MSSICGGIAAGILGLTGVYGFMFYFVAFVIGTFAVLVRTGFTVDKYFVSFKSAIMSELTSHILVIFD